MNDWLEGTTRYQMTDAQRAFWIDLLAMAGRSRFGGVVCSGKDGEQWIGYPLSKFQGLLTEPIDIEATLEMFQRTGKITMEVGGEGTRKLYTLFISNWAHYQSEYERKRGEKARRNPNVPSDVPRKSAAISPSISLESTSTEGESDGESDGEKEKTSCATSQIAVAPAAIFLPLNDKSEYPIPHKSVEEWKQLYPAVDVLQALRAMRGWLLSHKENRKTRSGVLKFVTAWLNREQDKTRPGALNGSNRKPTNAVNSNRGTNFSANLTDVGEL